MLRKKAAEELKKEQERKAAERRRIIEERCGKPKNIEDANEGIYASYFPDTFHPPTVYLFIQRSILLFLFLIDDLIILIIPSNHSYYRWIITNQVKQKEHNKIFSLGVVSHIRSENKKDCCLSLLSMLFTQYAKVSGHWTAGGFLLKR